MEKITVETEIWPENVKYAEEITEESLAKLGEKFMKRVKVLIVLFVCMAVMAVWLVMALLTDALGLLAALLNAAEKLLNDTGIAVQRAAIDLANTARGWLRWAVR